MERGNTKQRMRQGYFRPAGPRTAGGSFTRITGKDYIVIRYQIRRFVVSFVWECGIVMRSKELREERRLNQEGLALKPKDIPYSALMQDKRAYEIMLLRDQYENTFTDIAKEFGISTIRAAQIYNRIKRKQRGLYIRHISFVLGHENTAQIEKIFDDAFECYQDKAYTCAYLEKKYRGILTEYRDGEPGMPTRFLIDMPPFKPQPSQETIARVIEMRESERASFAAIAKELGMTRAKAKHTYDSFYHKKVLALIQELQAKAANSEEKRAIWDDCFKSSKSPKGRYDILLEKQAPGD